MVTRATGGGRKPLPTAVKVLNGNPGKERLPAPGEEPEYAAVDVTIIEPPEYLGEYGRAEWLRIGPELAAMGLLTEADMPAFEAYCITYQTMVEARLDIEARGLSVQGSRGLVKNPAVTVLASSVSSIRALAAEFGLTPSSRARIRLPGDADESDEFDQILDGAGDLDGEL